MTFALGKTNRYSVVVVSEIRSQVESVFTKVRFVILVLPTILDTFCWNTLHEWSRIVVLQDHSLSRLIPPPPIQWMFQQVTSIIG